MINWPTDLIDCIARRRCVIVLGSGISKNSCNKDGLRPRNWAEFLETASAGKKCEAQVKELLHRKDYLTACEVIKLEVGNDSFIDMIQDEYKNPGYMPSKLHESIFELDSPIVVSPNFDTIYECYASAKSNGTIMVKDQTDIDIIRYLIGGKNRLIIKSHGSVDNPHNLIFTREEYAQARTKYQLFYEILQSLVITHRFLFLGCGVDDPDVRMIFEDVQFAHSQMPFHFFSLPQNEVPLNIQGLIKKTMRLQFLEYSPNNGHRELTESISSLVQLVEDHRDQLAESKLW